MDTLWKQNGYKMDTLCVLDYYYSGLYRGVPINKREGTPCIIYKGRQIKGGIDMLTKLCRCGKKIPVNQIRCKECEEAYTPPQRTKQHRDFYGGARWTKLSQVVRKKHPIDLYIYYTKGEMVRADMVHHIIPYKERPDLAYVEDNLIPLSNSSHKEIETIYSLGGTAKAELQSLLQKIITHFSNV